jgi:hypothetical protein
MDQSSGINRSSPVAPNCWGFFLSIPVEGLRSKQGSFRKGGAISDRHRRKRNQDFSESGRIRDRRIFDGGPRDREFGECGSNNERDFDAVEKCPTWTVAALPSGEQAMPLKRLKNDHRVTTWRGVEFWMADEAGSLVFCRISHEALRHHAKRTRFEGTDVKVFEVYQDLLEQVASDAFDADAINEAG